MWFSQILENEISNNFCKGTTRRRTQIKSTYWKIKAVPISDTIRCPCCPFLEALRRLLPDISSAIRGASLGSTGSMTPRSPSCRVLQTEYNILKYKVHLISLLLYKTVTLPCEGLNANIKTCVKHTRRLFLCAGIDKQCKYVFTLREILYKFVCAI